MAMNIFTSAFLLSMMMENYERVELFETPNTVYLEVLYFREKIMGKTFTGGACSTDHEKRISKSVAIVQDDGETYRGIRKTISLIGELFNNPTCLFNKPHNLKINLTNHWLPGQVLSLNHYCKKLTGNFGVCHQYQVSHCASMLCRDMYDQCTQINWGPALEGSWCHTDPDKKSKEKIVSFSNTDKYNHHDEINVDKILRKISKTFPGGACLADDEQKLDKSVAIVQDDGETYRGIRKTISLIGELFNNPTCLFNKPHNLKINLTNHWLPGQVLSLDDYCEKLTGIFGACYLDDYEVNYCVDMVCRDVQDRCMLKSWGPAPEGSWCKSDKTFKTMTSFEYRVVNLTTLDERLLIVDNSSIHQYAEWAPKGNGIVVVHKNNIFYRPEIEQEGFYQITKNGVENLIYNGVSNSKEAGSWLPAISFSPSGKFMAFGSYDDSNVGIIDIPVYGNISDNLSYQYLRLNSYRYSQAGSMMSISGIFYVDLQLVAENYGTKIEPIRIKQPSGLTNNNTIFYSIDLPNDNIIIVSWSNRIRNELYVVTHNIEKSIDKTVFKIVQKNGWISSSTYPYFNNNATEFLIILPQKQFDNDYWNHLVMVKINEIDGNSVMYPLTSGRFVVTNIVEWDVEKSLVYYLATVADDPSQQQFYRSSTLDINSRPECLSCNIKSENKGLPCLYNEALMSPSREKFVLKCGGPDVPHISIYNTNDSTKIMTWNDNIKIAKLMNDTAQPIVMKLKVPISNDFEADVKLFIPPDADLNGSIKYPLLIYVYAGPGSFQVTEEFNVDWGTYLVTNKNFIYAVIDGRGSGRRSNSLLFSVYRNLGTVEIYDQINVTRYLQNKFPFIDEKKTAIWGMSYGGYAAGMSMALDDKNTFKCGISIAPVTDWRLYNAKYTESYMGLPSLDDNYDGYEQAQLINKAKNIKSNSYYLIHGTLDDIVHYQHSLLLANELEKNNIIFRQQVYTNENHGIVNFRKHLYLSMFNFLDECLHKPE
ncbi:venom dipeptidyl peptidase 4-like [Aphidius gifuensis]|uniref:venom dipeptidyl peptidase 4-like n=1 Tax=Aphidius gifuensis TaxID=684658 RepID=UPI001CDBE58C|nr:venom dipeptidyl peptidase 4-like [Aphidius gifuensis]